MKLPVRPTAAAFTDVWIRDVLRPALAAVAGADGKVRRKDLAALASLDSSASLAADDLPEVFKRLGSRRRTATVDELVAQGRGYAFEAVEKAAGPDGRLSGTEARALGALSDDFFALRGPAPTYRASSAETVLTKYGLTDADALVEAAWERDDGNHRLSLKELEAGARALSARQRELGVVSDLDSTVIPAAALDALPAPFPGVAALYRELERAQLGDVRYVTARNPERLAGLPDYLAEHGLPDGPIDTGRSTLPWEAQKEKISDITRIFEANPTQRFVLFGDSKHRDPEVYREVRRLFPDRVAAAFIHQVTDTLRPERVEGLTVIRNYAEAAALLFGQGELDEAAARRVIGAARAEGLSLTDAQVEALLDAQR